MAKHPPNVLSLVADVGGTNTRVALADGPLLLPETVRKYRNADYAGLETVIRTYIEQEDGVDCIAAAVAVAGPVRDGKGELTNLDWSIDVETVARATTAERAAVLNDLQAQGFAVGMIAPENLRTVIEGPESDALATRMVIGVGTGFNIAPVFETAGGRHVPPSEAGHANVPLRTDEELRLLRFIETAHGFPGVEDVLSGRGLERVYAWRRSEAGESGEKRAADIMAACEDGSDPHAVEAVEWFVRILGTVAGNLSLIHLPFGGVYLIGGVARAVTPYFQRFGFADSFRDKGRFSGFMKNFGVQVIEDDYAALNGLANHIAN
ncbi:MAG: ROK family protein [Silicimonas sp.]|nr:ROK family protein [Silicimonas sp.]